VGRGYRQPAPAANPGNLVADFDFDQQPPAPVVLSATTQTDLR
jgi:hypothetical protein